MQDRLLEERDWLFTLKVEENGLEADVDDLRKLIAAGVDPWVVANWGRSRYGGKDKN